MLLVLLVKKHPWESEIPRAQLQNQNQTAAFLNRQLCRSLLLGHQAEPHSFPLQKMKCWLCIVGCPFWAVHLQQVSYNCELPYFHLCQHQQVTFQSVLAWTSVWAFQLYFVFQSSTRDVWMSWCKFFKTSKRKKEQQQQTFQKTNIKLKCNFKFPI